ncbi:MAG: SpoIID/LytB domain-containing protein [Gaiellaceae bacterium]
MRRLTLLVASLLALVFATSAAASPIFVLTGRGWGHGIGMSQWGAQGLALHGATHQEILARYYEGTTLGTRTGTVRVLLTSGRTSFSFGSPQKISGGGKSVPAGTYSVHRSGTNVVFGGKSWASGTSFSSAGLLSVDGQRFRGKVRIYASGSLSAVNVLPLDSYVQGVVANESPASWRAQALQAQADAARSYALAAGGHCGNAVIGSGVLCRGTSDQVYGGVDSETLSTNAAVAATRGEVVMNGSSVATTFFFSTSGGKTVNKGEEWGPPDISYLQTEDDPYDDISPHHRWGPNDPEDDCPGPGRDCVFTAAGMSTRLGIAGIKDMKVGLRNSGSRVERVNIATASGSPTRTGASLRTALGLRSTWFTIGVLNVTPSKLKSVCGSRVRLNVVVRNVAGVTLQQRPASGGAWQNLAVTSTGPDTFTAVHKPCRATVYRLDSPSATGADVKVRVAPLIVFDDTQPAAGTALKGKVRPLSLAGRTVNVERKRADGTWRHVGSATVRSDGTGTWRANFNVVEGTYRARITPPSGSGLIPGVSPPLTVQFG